LEIVKVVQRATWETVGVLAINLAIVLYMLKIRVLAARSTEVHK
jgi:uncharacterized membrane protein (DUF2068 family)